MSDDSLTYASSGVNIDAASQSIRRIESAVKATYTDRVLSGAGAYGGQFLAQFEGYARPILVSSIDGVGTKTKVAQMAGSYSGLGQDIVNHCVNDILCQGAHPLFFLDYFGCSQLEQSVLEGVVESAASACSAVGCALIGGETAEMPGVYVEGEVDVVGAIVGVVDDAARLPKDTVDSSSVLIGLASSGLHTNGFSLARKALFDSGGYKIDSVLPFTTTTLGEALLSPHRCYYTSVSTIMQEFSGLQALAHITGGGFYDNLPRVLPDNITAVIEKRTWTPLPIFEMIQTAGNIAEVEMYRVFNMGIGMILVVRPDQCAAIVQRLNELGEHAAIIGELQRGAGDVRIV